MPLSDMSAFPESLRPALALVGSAETGVRLETTSKLASLRASLRDLGSAVIAFSAGVDSTFLLRVAPSGRIRRPSTPSLEPKPICP